MSTKPERIKATHKLQSQGKETTWLLLLGLLAITFTASAEDASSPRVVRTEPENGSRNVPASITQISVHFDRDMNQRGYSFTGGGAKFPTVKGKPFWKDARTCVLPVQLLPGRQYQFGINSPSHQSFRALDDTPVAPIIVTFATVGMASRKDDQRAAVARLKNVIGTRYSHFEVRQADWPRLWQKFEPKLLQSDSPRQFAVLAGELLAATEDPHIWLKEAGEIIPAFRREVSPNASWQAMPRHIQDWQRPTAAVAVGKANDQIGYIAPLTWNGRLAEQDYAPLYEAIKRFSDLPGLIIDVRFNSGGDEGNARRFAGCFITKRRLYARHRNLDPHSDDGFSQPVDRWLEVNPDGLNYRGKIAVLMGPYVMSSAEAFLLMMKQAPTAKLIGSPSFGASGNPREHDLGNGVSVYLPSWQAMDPDGFKLEGRGITPDITVDTDSADFMQHDPILQTGIESLMP